MAFSPSGWTNPDLRSLTTYVLKTLYRPARRVSVSRSFSAGHRLDDVFGETRRLRARDIRLHAETAHGDRGGVRFLAQGGDDIEAGAVRQADVAEQDVEGIPGQDGAGLPHAAGGHDTGVPKREIKCSRTRRVSS